MMVRNALRTALVLAAGAVWAWAAPGVATAQEPKGVHLTLTPYIGPTVWAKEVNLEEKLIYGGRAGLMFGSRLGIEGTFGRTSTRSQNGPTSFVDPGNTDPSVDTDLRHLGADLVFNLIPGSVFNPYVLAGWQQVEFDREGPTLEDETFNGWEAAAGFKLYLHPRVALRGEARNVWWRFDSPPAVTPPGEDTNHNWFFTGGVQFALGGRSADDDDKDGVDNDKDECPDTPLGAIVDARGCPLDSDGDGVFDGIDQCPNTPARAVVDARGCPTDSDGDGVFDGIDQCPNTPSGVAVNAQGCPPDSDGDGVPDHLDRCPNTPSGIRVNAQGCPEDSDGDGVTDDKDLCANTPQGVKVDKDGCPIEVSEYEVELLDKGVITTRDIHFETAKWNILPQSEKVLRDIGQVLIQWPQLRIEIGGHADWRGSNEYNQDLSEKRANSVRAWLLEHYPQVDASMFTAVGYGEERPVATNKTVEGMAMNRRVEFKVLNPDELRKVKESRRLLREGE